MANRPSEITIGYPESPLNVGSAKGVHGPGPGARIFVEEPCGAGDTPRLTLIAKGGAQAVMMLQNHSRLLEPVLRTPAERSMWLVRTDGYVAVVAREDDWPMIEACSASVGAMP